MQTTRYFIKFSYIGTRYRGLQKDNSMPIVWDADSIQGAIECALAALTPRVTKKPYLTLSSRTDVGVHALSNTGHVDLESRSPYKPTNLLIQANHFFSYCRHDIRFQEVIPVTDRFHCRSDAKSRTYVYRFMKAKDPTTIHVPFIDAQYHFKLRSSKFDLEKARAAAQLFKGVRDFRTFCGEELPDFKKPIRELEVSDIVQTESMTPYDPVSELYDYYIIKFKSKGFLYNQVRRMTAAILACATGKLTEKEVQVMLQVPGRQNWNPQARTLPAHGLQLVNVEYDSREIEEYTIKELCDNETDLEKEEQSNLL